MAAKKDKTLNDLFEDGLKDIYYAEKKILAALPKMAKAAQSEELASAFEQHRDETEQQLERLEQVFQAIDQQPKGKKCPGIEGIIEEGKEIIDEFKGMSALDAGLLAAAQAVEHYEITRYGSLIAWANRLELADAVPLLKQNLDEEKRTDPSQPTGGCPHVRFFQCAATAARLRPWDLGFPANRIIPLKGQIDDCGVVAAGRESVFIWTRPYNVI